MPEHSKVARAPSILIVNDSPYGCECLHNIFAPEGYIVTVVSSGSEGLAVLRNIQTAPDLIVVGWLMANIDAL